VPELERFRAAHPLLSALPEETLRRLQIYANLLEKWQRAVNLVSASTLDDLWVRHIADSLQLAEAVPEARKWLDLGSGAGLPGLMIAIKLADEPGALVHLIESSRRKCAFLREAARATDAPGIVHCGRIEEILPGFDEPIEAVTARALAPLPKLLGYAEKFLDLGAIGVFAKGKNFEAEGVPSFAGRRYLISTIASKTDPAARLVLVRRRMS
jgi:16S rRNA (guanine527-N7)-methyltransferase